MGLSEVSDQRHAVAFLRRYTAPMFAVVEAAWQKQAFDHVLREQEREREAFAAVVLKWVKDFDLDMEKVNINGGAMAMGHPLGATGAMILGTVVDELERSGGRYGLITLCIGGGMGVATIIERV